jgi:hypothetical protein
MSVPYNLPYIALPTDQPDYEYLSELTMEQKQALPGRFHTPVWSLSTPGLFICRVCWVDGEMVGWPCKPALRAGENLFGTEQQLLRPGQRVQVGPHFGTVKSDPHPTTRVRLDGHQPELLTGDFPTRFVHPLPIEPPTPAVPAGDVFDPAGPEPDPSVLVLHDPAGIDINGGYLHRAPKSGWLWSNNPDGPTSGSDWFSPHGLEWGVPEGSIRGRTQGPLVVVRRATEDGA